MKPMSISVLTVCGIGELDGHRTRGVSHILSILDPGFPEPLAFQAYDPHRRATLHFHDEIEPGPRRILPQSEHVAAILAFGRSLAQDADPDRPLHLLVHCHMGISRSTAAMAALLAQAHPEQDGDEIFERILQLRPQAWPNCLMVGFADELLQRNGGLTAALGRLYAGQLRHTPGLAQHMRENGRAREVDMAEASGARACRLTTTTQ
jgi:predicted protein tyrosine phosphatase